MANQQRKFTRWNNPFLLNNIPIAKFSRSKLKVNLALLSSLHEHLFESTQLLDGLISFFRESNVSLHDFIAIHLASVCNGNRGTCQNVLFTGLDFQVAVFVGGVGQAIAEFVERFNIILVKVTVANVDTFSILDLV